MGRRFLQFIGYSPAMDYRIRVAYVVNGISMMLAILFIYYYGFYAKYSEALPGIILYFLSTLTVFLLLGLKRYMPAKILILVGFMMQECSIVFYLFSGDIHFNLFMFIVAPITFFIFDFDNKWEKRLTFVFTSLAVVLFTASEVILRTNYLVNSTKEIEHLFNSVSAFSAILTITIVFFFFSYEISKVQSELKHLANTDSLTSIFNRRLFFELAQFQFELAKKYERKFSIIILDVDHFKNVNDHFGHPAGDKVLIDMVNLIRGMIRKGDVLSRYGGEEFAIMLKDTEMEASLSIAEKIRRAVEGEKFTVDAEGNPVGLNITVSIGVAGFRAEYSRFDDMIKIADNNLYEAKETGRNKVVGS